MIIWTDINEAMRSKDTVREESIGDEKRERDWTMGEERIVVGERDGGMDGGGREEGGARNRSCILLGSLRFLGKRGLEIRAGERTIEGL